MSGMSRRRAVAAGAALAATVAGAVAAGGQIGPAGGGAAPGAAGAPRAKWVIADERPVLVKLRGVKVDGADEAKRTVDLTAGPADARVRMTGVPLGEGFNVRVSHVQPGALNNVPFDWQRMKDVVGKTVSARLHVEGGRLALDSLATADD